MVVVLFKLICFVKNVDCGVGRDCELNNTEMVGDETDLHLELELGCDEVEVIIGDS